MRALIVCTLLLLWAVPALAAQKSLDGFGPVKFGMTVDEAWEAIGGRGTWETPLLLVHQEGLPPFMKNRYVVKIELEKETITRIDIEKTNKNEVESICTLELLFILRMLADKYGNDFIQVIYETSYYMPYMTYIFSFPFAGGAHITVEAKMNIQTPVPEHSGPYVPHCDLVIQYRAPLDAYVNPF